MYFMMTEVIAYVDHFSTTTIFLSIVMLPFYVTHKIVVVTLNLRKFLSNFSPFSVEIDVRIRSYHAT